MLLPSQFPTCVLSLDPHDSNRACAIGFIFTIVICAAVLTAFALCFVPYSLGVSIYVLFPAFVEKSKTNYQLSGHLCTYVTNLSNTKSWKVALAQRVTFPMT